MKLFLFSLLAVFTFASESGLSGHTSDADTTSVSSSDVCGIIEQEQVFDSDFFQMMKEDLEDAVPLPSLSTLSTSSPVSSAETPVTPVTTVTPRDYQRMEENCWEDSVPISSSSCASSSATTPRIYPTVPCAYKPEYHEFLSNILDLVPTFRSQEIFTVKTMQDLRYIVIVLKPQLGPLFRFFRLEFDWNAIRTDCKDVEDEAEFHQFIQMI